MRADVPTPRRALNLTDRQRAILSHLHRHGRSGVATLTASLGISPAATAEALVELADKRLIDRPLARTAGAHDVRGETMAKLRSNALETIGLGLSTRNFQVVRSDLRGKCLEDVLRPTVAGTRAELVAQAMALVDPLVLAQGAPLLGVGIVIPGMVGENGRIFDLSPGQRGIPYDAIKAAIESRHGLPVVLESTARSVARLEAHHARGGSRVLLFVMLGMEIGAALIADGAVFSGGFNQAANIGAFCADTGPRPSLVDLARHLGCRPEELTDEGLAALHAAGDPRLAIWIETRGEALSAPLSSAVQLLNPDTIVLGGALPRPVLWQLMARIRLDLHDTPGRRTLSKPRLRVAVFAGSQAMTTAASMLPWLKPPMPPVRR